MLTDPLKLDVEPFPLLPTYIDMNEPGLVVFITQSLCSAASRGSQYQFEIFLRQLERLGYQVSCPLHVRQGQYLGIEPSRLLTIV